MGFPNANLLGFKSPKGLKAQPSGAIKTGWLNGKIRAPKVQKKGGRKTRSIPKNGGEMVVAHPYIMNPNTYWGEGEGPPENNT